jgi:hypothetical protein
MILLAAGCRIFLFFQLIDSLSTFPNDDAGTRMDPLIKPEDNYG